MTLEVCANVSAPYEKRTTLQKSPLPQLATSAENSAVPCKPIRHITRIHFVILRSHYRSINFAKMLFEVEIPTQTVSTLDTRLRRKKVNQRLLWEVWISQVVILRR